MYGSPIIAILLIAGNILVRAIPKVEDDALTTKEEFPGDIRHGGDDKGKPEETMSDKEKKRFSEMTEDKKINDAETQNYTPPKAEKTMGKGNKRGPFKDPYAPKRSLSAFFWFCMDEKEKVRKMYPKYGEGDIGRELGKMWLAADPEIKSKYEAIAEEDEARYERELIAYNKKMANTTGEIL